MNFYNKKTNRGFVTTIGAVIAILVIAGGGYFLSKNVEQNKNNKTKNYKEVVVEKESDNKITEEIMKAANISDSEKESTENIEEKQEEQAGDLMTGSAVPKEMMLETITLAGGCFWCIESFYQELPGVTDAISGYAGGDSENANYVRVTTGHTKHRESVQVTFDTSIIPTEKIIDLFWTQINPVDNGGQFADRGFQYTTAIYYHDEDQKRLAELSRERLKGSDLFEGKIETELVPLTTFFEAEEYHQDYYLKASDHYKRYKKGSGREGFIDDNWAKEAALEFLSNQNNINKENMDTENNQSNNLRKSPSDYTDAEIEVKLKELEPLTYKVVAEEGTEKSFNNTYWDNKEPGLYVDVVTGEPLFSSTHKFDSGTGWPSFWRSLDNTSISLHEDNRFFIKRTEVRSRSGHLGHIFNDGPKDKGGQRYCMNSAALNFVHKDDLEKEGYSDYLDLFE